MADCRQSREATEVFTVNEAIRSFPFLQAIDRDSLARSGMRRLTMSVGTPAFIEGQPCQHVALVVRGAIRVFKSAPDGRQLTLYHVGPGDTCVLMWSSVLAEANYPAQAAAATESDVFVVPVAKFNSLMNRYDAVRQFVYKSMAKRLAAVMMLVDEILFRQVDERLAGLLLQRTDADTPALPTTHEQLALELGTAREVVSRILKSFELTGAVALYRGRVDVLDRSALEQMNRSG